MESCTDVWRKQRRPWQWVPALHVYPCIVWYVCGCVYIIHRWRRCWPALVLALSTLLVLPRFAHAADADAAAADGRSELAFLRPHEASVCGRVCPRAVQRALVSSDLWSLYPTVHQCDITRAHRARRWPRGSRCRLCQEQVPHALLACTMTGLTRAGVAVGWSDTDPFFFPTG